MNAFLRQACSVLHNTPSLSLAQCEARSPNEKIPARFTISPDIFTHSSTSFQYILENLEIESMDFILPRAMFQNQFFTNKSNVSHEIV